MAYRTLLTFEPPVPTTLDLAVPGEGRRQRAVRVAGLGREGLRHFVELADGGGGAAERLPLAHVRSAYRRRSDSVDLALVLLDAAERTAFRTGRPVRYPPRWSGERRLREFGQAAILFGVSWVAGLVALVITGSEEAMLWTLVCGVIGIPVVGLVLLIPPLQRRWLRLRLLLRRWP